MYVYFIGSKSHIKQDAAYMREILNIVREEGHEITRDWIDEAYDSVVSGEKQEKLDWRKIHQANADALSKADVAIVDATRRSYSVGFQVATAIHQKKPVLVLTRNNALAGTFGSGVQSDFVQHLNYTDTDTLRKGIADFLRDNTMDSKDLRFNFFIDRQIHNYLRWASYSSGKTKSEIIRELIEREINKEKF
jgi:hypothetical protein